MDPSIAAALIGGGTAIVVVLVTTLIALIQLRHDRQQRAADRALQAKRELLVEALKSAIVMLGAASELSRQDVDIRTTSSNFTGALASFNAASAVASLEALARGRDFVNAVAQNFTAAMTQRAILGADAGHDALGRFAMEIVHSQRAFQRPYELLVAAIRRDLGIDGASDEDVSDALRVDADIAERHAHDMLRKLQL